jgi:thymidylate synthase
MALNQNNSFASLDDIQNWILSAILERGEEANPRGMRTLELYPVMFTLLNPRQRCITNPLRKWSLPLAVGEFCWHVAGSNELSFIEYYAPRWRDFADAEATIEGSCYGHRVFNLRDGGLSQWQRLVQLLESDPNSRRAVLHFSEPTLGLDVNAKDVACAQSLQFLVRSGRVHAIAYMRSNDAIWGLPYDVFLFTMLQELLACELKLDLGTYTHTVASLHLYERHFSLARSILEFGSSELFEMPPMKAHHDLARFLDVEAQIRSGTGWEDAQGLDSYWENLLEVLEWFRDAKGQDKSRARETISFNSPYCSLLLNSFPTRTSPVRMSAAAR